MSAGDYLSRDTLESRRVAECIDSARVIWLGATTNVGNAYTGQSTIPITRILTGQVVRFLCNATNTGAATLAINSPSGVVTVSAVDLRNPSGGALNLGDISTPNVYEFVYDGSTYRMLSPSLGVLGLNWGTYTPVANIVANLDAATPTLAHYSRVGDNVIVGGAIDLNATLTATLTTVRLSLPIASDLQATVDVAGTAFCGTVPGEGAIMKADAGNDNAVLEYTAVNVAALTMFYHYIYRVR